MLEQTEIYHVINRARLLASETLAWYEALDPKMRREILDLIRYEQLNKRGIDEDGDIIGEYSRATEWITQGRKKEGDPYTLKDTGAFYQSMFVTVLRDSFIVDGDTEKMEGENWWLRNNISAERILGLTDENLQIVIEKFKVKYHEYLTKILYGS